MILETHESKISHLLRRTGFTSTKRQVDELRNHSLTEIVELLLNAPQPAPKAPTYVIKDQESEKLAVQKAKQELPLWWIYTMRDTPNPLLEVMTLFWHGHFTSAAYKVRHPGFLARQNELLRHHALGNFRTFTYEISIDPAMLVWLDNGTNVKKSPNENYARELMELFTLGIGAYTETDVKEAARALTGWKLEKTGEVKFIKNQFDNGSKTVLGKSGNLGLRETIDIVVEHPACARFIATKLWSFFAYPNPEDEVIDGTANAFKESGFEIKSLLRAIFTSDAFYSDRAYRAVVKNPAEYVVGLLALFPQLKLKNEAALLHSMDLMGQELFNPPNVAGWPGGAAWLNSSALLARCNFADVLVSSLTVKDFPLQSRDVDEVIDDVLARTGFMDLSVHTRASIKEYATQTFSNKTTLLHGILHLLFVSPEAQMK